MRRTAIAVLVTLILSSAPLLRADWFDVRPQVQPSFIDIGNHLAFRHVIIGYVGEELAWSANELKREMKRILLDNQITDATIEVDGVTFGEIEGQVDPWGPDKKLIVLGLTNDLQPYFSQSGIEVFAESPEEMGQPEGYYLWVSDDFSPSLDNPHLRVMATASSVRGINYAVTTIWQAMDVWPAEDLPMSLDLAYIVDYPVFPKREVINKYSFHQLADPWQNVTELAYGVLRLGREVILHNKGNGLIHFSQAQVYDDLANSTERGNIDAVLTKLIEGDDNQLFPSRWHDFQLDWFENIHPWISAQNDGANSTRRFAYRAVQVHDTCFVYPQLVNNRLKLGVVQRSITPDPQFEEWNGNTERFTAWNHNDDAWTRQLHADLETYYAQSSAIAVGENVRLSETFKLQPDTASPARSMVLSFAVNTNGPAKIKFNSFPVDPDGYFGDTDLSGYLVFRKKEITKNTGGNWERVNLVFCTYGSKWDSLDITFTNTGSSQLTVKIDSFFVTDSDFYHVYLLDNNSFATAALLNNGVNIDDKTDDVVYTEHSSYDRDDQVYHANVTVTGLNTSIQDILADTSRYRVVLTHWIQGFAPTAVASLDPLTIDFNSWRPQVRTNEPSLFVDLLTNHMTWFEDHFTENHTNPMQLSGWFCRYNELKFGGFMQEDSAAGVSCADTYAEFMSSAYEHLNADTPENPRPLMLYADMFSPSHNGRRFTLTNNPYFPVYGQRRQPDSQETEIRGANSEHNLVFLDWLIKDADQQEVDNGTLDYVWHNLPDPAVNHFEVVEGYLIEESTAQFNLRRDIYRNAVNMYKSRREEGMNFSGGVLGNDATDYVDNVNWDVYRSRAAWLWFLWNPTPEIAPFEGFPTRYAAGTQTAVGVFRAYPVPYPESVTSSLDSVVLQYRFGLSGTWQSLHLSLQSDSLYEFSLSLPDSGGVCEYRVWAFDHFGQYSSYPSRNTKLSDPDAGERLHFTFERRKNDPITKPTTFYTPGIISQEHQIEPGGSISIEPLPGYHYSTMLVSDSGAIKFVPSLLTLMSYFNVAGSDTSPVVFELADSATHWGGIQGDSLGIVELNYVTFNTGDTPIRFEKSPTDTMHVLDHAAFNSGLEIKGDVKIYGNAEAAGITVKNNGRLTIQPGSELSFADTARLVVEAGSVLTAVASDTNRIIFKAAVDSLGWLGIQFARGDNDESALHYCDIQNADAGIMTDHTPVELANCDITGCDVGILAINGAIVDVSNCSIENGGDGIILANLSLADIKNSDIGLNTGTGILALSRSTAYLKDSKVSDNNGDGTAGGIGLYTGSEAFLKCTEVNGNTGPGIMSFNGVVMLSSVDTMSTTALTNWRGNSIFDNVTVAKEGQLSLRGRVGLGIYNGHNRIADSTSNNLVWWEDHPTRDWWRDVYWGTTDTSAILNRLPSNVLLSKIDSSWSLCHSFVGEPTSPDSLIRDFLNPHNYEVSGNYTSARTSYKQIVENAQASDYAFAASDRLLTTDMASGGSFATTRDYLVNRLKLTSNVALKTWMNNSIAWCWAELDSFSRANQIYDSLANSTPTRLDRVSAHVQKHMVAVRQFSKDSVLHKPADVIARVDSARLAIERMNVWTQLTITDSVVVYAPATFEGSVSVKQPGQLWILPHPGSENPIVSFRGQGSVTVSGMNTQSPRSKFMVRGEADNIITLDWDSVGTTVWDNVSSSGGHVELEHATLRGRGFVSSNESSGQMAIFRADSCRFEGFDEGLWVWGVDSSSHIRNCTFTNVGADSDYTGTGFDAGVSVVEGNGFQIEDCAFENNKDMGIFAYFCGDLQVRNSLLRNNGEYGALVWDGGEVSFECSEFSSNGDTLAELWIENGTVNLVGGRNQFADSSGTLIYTARPSYIDLADGENQLQLWDENGFYLEVGDTTTSSDITWNNWLPVDPADSTFYDFLYPHDPAKWTVDSSLAEFIACGVAGGQSIGGGGNLIVVPSDGDGETYSTPGSSDDAMVMSFSDAITDESSGDYSEASRGFTKPPSAIAKSAVPISKLQKVALHHQELARWREFKNLAKFATKREGFEAGRSFVDAFPSSSLIPAALTRLSNLAKADGSDLGISAYLKSKGSSLPSESDRVAARRLSCLAIAYEGKAAEGLAGLEGLMDAAASPEDSIRALVDAMGIYYFYNQDGKLQPRHSQIRNESLPALGRRVRDLAKILENPSLAANDRTTPIPTAYHLYQNYPNPFNPVTEIAFDLPEAVRVELKVFNILGQEVATLMDAVRPAGAHRALWDSKSTTGMTVASGVYVYQIKAGKFIDAKKMVLIR